MSRKPSKLHKTALFISIGAIGIALLGVYAVPYAARTVYEKGAPFKETRVEDEEHIADTKPKKEAPNPLKGIYMSQCVVGTPSFRDSLVSFVESTDLNAVVIDIKDFSGTIGFPTTDPRFAGASLESCGARDMREFIARLHEKGIWVIGRITVFQDPHYSSLYPEQAVQSKSTGRPWKDHKGLNFIDVSSREFWDYIVALSKESADMGFDELNYDYIRYPSDGPMEDALYKNPNKAEALEKFFVYLHEQVEPLGVVTSADLFGMTASNTDDLGIGQQLERALPYFDYIMPMIYPSHYPDGFNGYSDPNDYPYEIIKFAMDAAVKRTIATQTSVKTLDGGVVMKTEVVPATADTATTTREVASGFYTKEAFDKQKIRPWLQDFDYGKSYLPQDILAQTKGTYDAGLTSWIFWDPANKYDSLRAVMGN